MIADGLEKEAKNLYPFRELSPLKTVGYKEFFPYFDGNRTLEEAISEIKKNSRHYAKRQITWFKKYDNAFSFPANTPVEEVYDLLTEE